MLVPERHARMLDHVRRHGSVRIDELARQFGVSPWTVRRDLAELERDGMLRRTHGGAYVGPRAAAGAGATVSAGSDTGPDPRRAAKERIAARAADVITDGSTVMLLGGSTTDALVPHLAQRQLTVVTNGLDIAYGFRAAPSVSVVLLGGVLHRAQMTLLGPMTEAAMADLHVDVIVAGAHGVDPDVGVTGAKIVQAGQHRGMLQHTDALLVLADATKFGRRGPSVLAAWDQVDTLITDVEADPAAVARLRGAGVTVVTV